MLIKNVLTGGWGKKKNVLTVASCTCVAIPSLADFHSTDRKSCSVNFLLEKLEWERAETIISHTRMPSCG